MFEFEFYELKINIIGKLRCGEAKKYEFEFIPLEINNIGESGCYKGYAVSRAQRSGPLLLILSETTGSILKLYY